MPILPRSPTAWQSRLAVVSFWPCRTHKPNSNGSHHWESNGNSNNLQDAPKNPAHLSLDTVSTIKLWLLPTFGNTISIIGNNWYSRKMCFRNFRQHGRIGGGGAPKDSLAWWNLGGIDASLSPWEPRGEKQVFPKIGGKTQKWMVKIMGKPSWKENPLFSETSKWNAGKTRSII